jgi:spore coat protein U-like protein
VSVNWRLKTTRMPIFYPVTSSIYLGSQPTQDSSLMSVDLRLRTAGLVVATSTLRRLKTTTSAVVTINIFSDSPHTQIGPPMP